MPVCRWRRHPHDEAVQIIDVRTPGGTIRARLEAIAGGWHELDVVLVGGWRRLARVTFPTELAAKRYLNQEIQNLCFAAVPDSTT